MREDIKNGFNRLVLSKLSTRPVMINCMFHLRLEYAIKELKPTPPDADLWNVYTTAAEKHCDDLLKKYQGDLETSQIFVSTFAFLCVFCPFNPFFSWVRRLCSLALPRLSSSKSWHQFNQTPPTSRTFPPVLSELRQSSSPVWLSHYFGTLAPASEH